MRKHWDLDIDFDTDSEGDSTFGKTLSSNSLEIEEEESPVKAGCPQQPCEKQPNLDEEDQTVEGGAQDASEENCDVSSEEAEILAKEQQEVLADEAVTNHGSEHEEMVKPAFADRFQLNFDPAKGSYKHA